MYLADVDMRLTLEQCLVAATLNAAASIGRSRTHGSLEVGKVADFLILDAPRWEHLIYQWADVPLVHVVKRLATEWGVAVLLVDMDGFKAVVIPGTRDLITWRIRERGNDLWNRVIGLYRNAHCPGDYVGGITLGCVRCKVDKKRPYIFGAHKFAGKCRSNCCFSYAASSHYCHALTLV